MRAFALLRLLWLIAIVGESGCMKPPKATPSKPLIGFRALSWMKNRRLPDSQGAPIQGVRNRASRSAVFAARRQRDFTKGQGVVIRGLSNSTKFNGRTGVVQQVTQKGVLVSLPDHPKPLLISPNKLVKCQRWLDKLTHELDKNVTYRPPPEGLRVVYSAIILKPGLATPPLAPSPGTLNKPPERFWVSQIAKKAEQLDVFYSPYDRLTITGQSQCGDLGKDFRSRYVDTHKLVSGDSPSSLVAKAAKGNLAKPSVEAFLKGFLSPDCEIPAVIVEQGNSGLSAPRKGECPRLQQLQMLFDNQTVHGFPDLTSILPSERLPPPTGMTTIPDPLDMKWGGEMRVGEDRWSALLDEIKAHFLYGLPLPWDLDVEAVEAMHRARLNLTRTSLSDSDYRHIVAGPFLYNLLQEMGEGIFSDGSSNITLFGVDNSVFNALIAVLGRKLRLGWPPDASHIVIEIAVDERTNTSKRHVVRAMLNNQEFALGERSAWIQWTDFIRNMSNDLLRPEDYPTSCAWKDTTKATISKISLTVPTITFPTSPLALPTINNVERNLMADHIELRQWLDRAGLAHLFNKFIGAHIHTVADARAEILNDIRGLADRLQLETSERLKLVQVANRNPRGGR